MPAPTRRALLAGSALALLARGRAWAGPDPRELGLSNAKGETITFDAPQFVRR